MEKAFILFQHLLPKHFVSRLAGTLARSERPWFKTLFIKLFIRVFGVDMNEALYPDVRHYANFNDFFTRPLKEGARPLANAETSLLCPADGAISQLGQIEDGLIFQAKGRNYSCRELLGGDEELAKTFDGGSFATIYLSPKDYHRVHMPCPGKLSKRRYIPGKLFSVNQITARNVARLFSRNERMVCMFESDRGPFAVIMVGAVIVAGIRTVWGEGGNSQGAELDDELPEVTLGAGDEMGRFYLGSTAILLFPKETVRWKEELEAGSPVRMGESMGDLL